MSRRASDLQITRVPVPDLGKIVDERVSAARKVLGANSDEEQIRRTVTVLVIREKRGAFFRINGPGKDAIEKVAAAARRFASALSNEGMPPFVLELFKREGLADVQRLREIAAALEPIAERRLVPRRSAAHKRLAAEAAAYLMEKAGKPRKATRKNDFHRLAAAVAGLDPKEEDFLEHMSKYRDVSFDDDSD